jgi:hypothetical protein
MWQGGPAEHPDEGTIHAWLDEALDAESAGSVATHVSTCAECAARVAEARGLIAGASRIIAALDDSPSGVRPPWAQAASATEGGGAPRQAAAGVGAGADARGGSLWRWLRITPGRAAIAATILVAIGVTLTHERIAEESAAGDAQSMVAVHNETELRRGASQGAAVGSPATAPAAPGTRPPAVAGDQVAADTTAARKFARERTVPTVERAPGPTPPSEPAAEAAARALATAPEVRERVAVGRAAARAQRETTSARADDVRTEVAASEADERAAEKEIAAADAANRSAAGPAPAPNRAAAKSAPREAQPSGVTAGMAMPQRRLAVAQECYRVLGAQPGARWGGMLLPVLVVVEAGTPTAPRAATVRATAAAEATRRATWTRTPSDSVRLTLDDATAPPILLGAESGGRAGTIASGGRVVVGRVDCESGASVR